MSPDQLLAWQVNLLLLMMWSLQLNRSTCPQGLSQLYERNEQWEKYASTLERLAQLFSAKLVIPNFLKFRLADYSMRRDDATKCAESLQNIVDLRRDTEKSTPTQVSQKTVIWNINNLTFDFPVARRRTITLSTRLKVLQRPGVASTTRSDKSDLEDYILCPVSRSQLVADSGRGYKYTRA